MSSDVAVDDVAFLDVEADRGGRVIAIGVVRGDEELRITVGRGDERRAGAALDELIGESPVGGHNVVAFDLPLLASSQVAWSPGTRPVIDTLVLSLFDDPGRATHALDKGPRAAGEVPDPVADARGARAVARGALARLGSIDPGCGALYVALLAAGGYTGTAERWARGLGCAVTSPHEAMERLPADFLRRFCRVRLAPLLDTVLAGLPSERLALALALRFIEERAEGGRVEAPPSPALASLPRFSELLTRLLGPLCPDHACAHREGCDVHRPFAEEVLARNFELTAFRPHQREVVHAVLGGKQPLVLLPTGGGKSLCFQLPAVHGADRLRGLTVVVSPLVALMADQVRSLSARYPGVCFVNSQLSMAERQQNLTGLRTGTYNIVYFGPEQLRNPSMLRLLANRPPFLWVIDEAHCISQWGHNFRTDYTHLPRAIAQVHRLGGEEPRMPPLLALFTATATAEVQADMAAQVKRGIGCDVTIMDFGKRRENLAYEVIATESAQGKGNELLSLLDAHPDGARLVYCATVRSAKDVAEMLRARGVPCALYHGRLAPRDKTAELERFLGGAVRTVVATSAFGMGIDKPDIRLVVHHELSGSIEDYVQETGRAGRDGAPARCVLLYCEDDLETQFYLKSAGRIVAHDVKTVFKSIRARAQRFGRRTAEGADRRVELWLVPEDLFAEDKLEVELDWERDELVSKLRLVLHHLEADGAVLRLENRTRAFGIFPALASLAEAEARLGPGASPATLRVVRYLYALERPRRISILDVADEAGILPHDAFRELQALTRAGIVRHDLTFEVTLAHGITPSSREIAARHFEVLDALFTLGTELDDDPVVQLRAAAVEIGRRLGRIVPPHQLFHLLRTLRRQGLLRLDKAGPGRYRVRFEPSFLRARDRLGAERRTAESLLAYAARVLGPARGKDVVFDLDVERFLREAPELFERRTTEDAVSACLLLHYLEVWHIADPPVVLETAMRVVVDRDAKLASLDLTRPRRQYEHDLGLVHMLGEYAVLPPAERESYLDDYFRLTRADFLRRHFRGRQRPLAKPVSPRTEALLLAGLTSAQSEAVTAEDRAILVVAGPGSGKTHTVVRRIAYLVRARQVRPEEILVLAYNRAAAAELRVRLEGALAWRASSVDVRTFHSFALRLTGADLRDDAVDAADRLDVALERAAELLETPAGFVESSGAETAEENRLRVLGPIRHVIVDEYQDLDEAQYRLLAAIVGLEPGAEHDARTERSVYVVGDDDQAIYGFRDASVEFLRRFEAEFAARRICLTENFRSNARIVTATAAFAATLPDRIKSEAESGRPAPDAPAGDEKAVRTFRYHSPPELAAHVAFTVKKSLAAGFENIAVIARRWHELDGVRFLLEEEGITPVIHHRDFHRPVHRRHPAARILRLLGDPKDQAGARSSTARAIDLLQSIVAKIGRADDEPAILELLSFASDIDRDRKDGMGGLHPISARELANELLLASRDAALRDRAVDRRAAVHLCTFHGSKGLEFDKVVVLPHSAGADPARTAEERRTFYVAITRARRELSLATFDADGELAEGVPAIRHDVRGVAKKLRTVRAAYLDCDPSDVVLASKDLATAQRFIAGLREGDTLDVDPSAPRTRLLRGDELVCVLSETGQKRLDAMKRRASGPLRAKVHELFVHLHRDPEGKVRRRSIVVLPTLCIGGQ